jgi:hypothetical protein
LPKRALDRFLEAKADLQGREQRECRAEHGRFA